MLKKIFSNINPREMMLFMLYGEYSYPEWIFQFLLTIYLLETITVYDAIHEDINQSSGDNRFPAVIFVTDEINYLP